ncbi:IS1380 family transposase, partial [Natronogracilivirga saccharolytica]
GGLVSDMDNVKAMIGLICLGKPFFDAIAEYRDEPWFAMALGLQRLPSPETLHQRIQSFPEKTGRVWRDFTTRLLAANPGLLGQKIHGQTWTVIDSDVSPMDNSDNQKEGVSWTYKNYAGYAPMFGYIGPYGLMLNNELRPGSAHSNCAGTADWFDQTLKMAGRVSPHRRLIVADSGNDSAENLEVFRRHADTDFLVKHNLRNDDPQQWLDMAKEQTGEQEYEKLDRGAWAWYGEREMVLPGQQNVDDEQKVTQRVVFRATERFAHPDGQCISPHLVMIDAYWTSLDWTPEQVHACYNQRGTSEQYHSELKSDMGVERLPSGKFAANQQILDLAMIALINVNYFSVSCCLK